MQHIVAPSQDAHRVNRGDEKTCHHIGRNEHVRVFGRRRRIERSGHRVDVDQLAVAVQLKTGWRVHPCVRHHHEYRAQRAAHRDWDGCQPVDHRGQAVPAVQVQAQEDRLDEESKAFGREGQAEDRARERHEPGPQQAELERECRAGNRADCKQDAKGLRPSACEIQPHVVFRPQPQPFGGEHQQRKADAQDREDDMKAKRRAHRRPREGYVVHEQ